MTCRRAVFDCLKIKKNQCPFARTTLTFVTVGRKFRELHRELSSNRTKNPRRFCALLHLTTLTLTASQTSTNQSLRRFSRNLATIHQPLAFFHLENFLGRFSFRTGLSIYLDNVTVGDPVGRKQANALFLPNSETSWTSLSRTPTSPRLKPSAVNLPGETGETKEGKAGSRRL